MRIQHNIAALNANRQLGVNNNSVSKNLEKLSSGYKINRAGDDAAGLAISEKMRGQIRGLDQATNNANDGISLVQTAEGALNETASILQRMKELATQASNGTYRNEVDRENISKEVESLKKEITRISTSTNFNKTNLLDNSLGGYAITRNDTTADSIANVTATGGKLAGIAGAFKVAVDATGVVTCAAGDTKYLKSGVATATSTDAIILTKSTSGNATTFTATVDKTKATAEEAEQWEGVTITVTTQPKPNSTSYTAGDVVADTGASKGLTLQIGDTASPDQRVTVNIGDMSAKGLSISNVSVADQDSALSALKDIDNAINTVSGTRADLGALQNRLEHTVSNLGVTSENLTSAESRIRDVDMAKEMMEMTKNNVLAQAAQSMLAQANTQPQNVLKLLQ